jgi:hypothetical protein
MCHATDELVLMEGPGLLVLGFTKSTENSCLCKSLLYSIEFFLPDVLNSKGCVPAFEL